MWSKLSGLKDLDRDDLLEYLGLQTKRSAAETLMPAIAMFGVGVLVGAGIGLILAPKSGPELREDLRHRLQGGADRVAGAFPAAAGTERAPKSF